MIRTAHLGVTAASLALVAALSACGAEDAYPTPEAASTAPSTASAPPAGSSSGTSPVDPRPQHEKAFLDDLAHRGIPFDAASDTTVEVGLGICRGLDEGLDPGAVLARIRPVTEALAAQDGDRDADEVGRELIEASRAHLCP